MEKRNVLFLDKKDKIVFLVGCFATFYINLIGRVYVGELIIFLIYLFVPQARISLPKNIKIISTLLYIWLLSAIISDLWNQTPFIDMVKGITSILFLIVLLPFVYWALYDRLSRWMVFYLGTIISSQLTYYLITSQTTFGSADIWRIYSYSPLITGLAVYLYWKGKFKFSYLTFILFGLWILFGGSRNVFITCTFTVLILYVIDRYLSYDIADQLSIYRHRTGTLIVVILIGLVAVDNIYESLASNGTLGEEAYKKYIKQSTTSLGLASGRIEAIMDADLISKSPFVGYGSYAKDRTAYVKNFYIEHQIPFHPSAFDHDENSVENMLPRHSRIGGLWMWHGIGAGIFWIYILYIIFRTFKTGAFLIEPRLIGLSVFTMMSEVWDIFFSIMSVRLPLLFLIVYLILIYQRYKELETNCVYEYDTI